jgi:hypothetical protein
VAPWRNGRRRGFKIPRPNGLASSSLAGATSGTLGEFVSPEFPPPSERHNVRHTPARSGNASCSGRRPARPSSAACLPSVPVEHHAGGEPRTILNQGLGTPARERERNERGAQVVDANGAAVERALVGSARSTPAIQPNPRRGEPYI